MAIIRAATTVELATNIAVRAELIEKRKLEPAFVGSLMRWANGLGGKFHQILQPLFAITKEPKTFREIETEARKVNKARNEIAHTGSFASKKHAKEVLDFAHSVCSEITSHYPASAKLAKA